MKKKKIVIFTTDLYRGGVAESSRKIANYLANLGSVNVVLVVYENLPQLKSIDAKVKLVTLGIPLIAEFRGRKTIVFRLARLVGFPLVIIKFLFLVYRERPNTIYSLMYVPNIINVLIAKIFSVKSIISERQNPSRDLSDKPKYFVKLLSYIYNKASCIHINSKGLSDEISRFYRLDSPKYVFFPNFFDIPVSKNIVQKKNCSSLNVLLAGRHTEQKGFDYLPKIIQATSDDIYYTIVCASNEIEKMSAQFDAFNVDTSRYSLIDEVPRLIDLMPKYDCFLLLSNWETFGNVVVEAMFVGLPVVSNHCLTGPVEIIDNTYGLITTVGLREDERLAVKEIAFYLEELNSNEEFYERYSRLSLERASFFTEESVSDLIAEALSISK